MSYIVGNVNEVNITRRRERSDQGVVMLSAIGVKDCFSLRHSNFNLADNVRETFSMFPLPSTTFIIYITNVYLYFMIRGYCTYFSNYKQKRVCRKSIPFIFYPYQFICTASSCPSSLKGCAAIAITLFVSQSSNIIML